MCVGLKLGLLSGRLGAVLTQHSLPVLSSAQNRIFAHDQSLTNRRAQTQKEPKKNNAGWKDLFLYCRKRVTVAWGMSGNNAFNLIRFNPAQNLVFAASDKSHRPPQPSETSTN